MMKTAIGHVARASLAVMSLACTPSNGRPDATPVAPAAAQSIGSERPERTLDHIAPARDSVGASPSYFEWTAVPGADGYAIGVWNEVDGMVWRQSGLRSTSVMRPKDLTLEPGTYFWSVTALRDDTPVAESGRSAFVVRPPDR